MLFNWIFFLLQGILSSVFLDGSILHGWKMIPIPFHNLNEVPKNNLIIEVAHSRFITVSTQRELKDKSGESQIHKKKKCISDPL